MATMEQQVMRRAIAYGLGVALAGAPAIAQTYRDYNGTIVPGVAPLTFLPNGNYVNVPSVGTGGANSAIPGAGLGSNIIIYNYGSNPLLVKMASSSSTTITAATADAIIQPNSTEEIAIGAYTNIIYASTTSTTSMQIVGGSGLALGWGGGSSSGGGGGTVNQGTGGASAWLVTGTGGTFPVTGATSNASSAVATSSTNVPGVSFLYGFNGTTWDQLQVDGSKYLKVNCVTGCGGSGGTAITDEAAFTYGATNLTPVGGVYNSSITNLTSGQGGAVALTAARSMHVLDDNSAALLTAAQAGTGTYAATYPTAGVAFQLRGSTTNPTAVTDGQSVAPMGTPEGKMVTQPFAPTAQWVDGGGSKTDTSALTVIAASGSASLKEYVTGLQCSRSDAGTTAITVALSEGTKTRTFTIPNSGGGGGNNAVFNPPIAFAANTAVTATASSGVTTLYCNAQGFYAP